MVRADGFIEWYREMKSVLKVLSREAILKANDITKELVDVPEWGGAVYVQAMTGAERDEFELATLEKRGKRREANLHNFRARLVAHTVVDDDGKRLFSDSDVEELGHKSAAALNRIYEAAARLSGISDAEVDELVGESASGQSDDSGTA